MPLHFKSRTLRRLTAFCTKPPSTCIQTRNVFLLHAIKSKGIYGLHKIIPFEALERPAKNRLGTALLRLEKTKRYRPFGVNDLPVAPEPESSEKILSLKVVKKEHIRPGFALCREIPLKTSIADEGLVSYTIQPLRDLSAKLRQKPSSLKGRRARQIHFSTTMKPDLFIMRMSQAYSHITLDIPVEIHIKPVNKGSWASIDWSLKHQLHLDPDVILAAMPSESHYCVRPKTDGKEYCWVMGSPLSPYGKLDTAFKSRRTKLMQLQNKHVKPEWEQKSGWKQDQEPEKEASAEEIDKALGEAGRLVDEEEKQLAARMAERTQFRSLSVKSPEDGFPSKYEASRERWIPQWQPPGEVQMAEKNEGSTPASENKSLVRRIVQEPRKKRSERIKIRWC